jgi:uncharacterized protein (DUF885 family)
MSTQVGPAPEGNSLIAALRIIDDAWEEYRRSPYVQHQLGEAPARLPEISLTEAQRRSAVGRSISRRLEAIDLDLVPHDVALTLGLVRFRAKTWSYEADWYWIVSDPLGTGFFGMFLPTAYCGGALLNLIHGQLASLRSTERGDADRYLALVADYARLIDQFTERTAAQAERGMRMPKVQVRQSRALLSAFKSRIRDALGIEFRRSTGAVAKEFTRELENRIATQIEPAFDRALGGLSEDYFAQAPDSVGLGQYPGGAEVYAELVKLHTTLKVTPEKIHAIGIARIAEIEESMRRIRADLGFAGDNAAFLEHFKLDPRWRANTAEEVTATFQRYMNRFRARLNEYFSVAPKATYRAAPLAEALQGSMTFGYYDAPTRNRPEGIYLFNTANLLNESLLSVGTLTYHELMPGHHLHIATQQENKDLHPFRKYGIVSAYNEGWAEYAASFAGEIGLYERPEERYGRLAFDAFLTCRLVVDTGMNAFSWSRERAQKYMREHSGMSEAVIQMELIRYSCDIPGQALVYKLGDTQIMAMRDRMRHALGLGFKLKEFHSAVLKSGALPMPELEWHIEHEIRKQRQHE